MSKNKQNLGEPYQIYSEVLNVGKTVEGSKKKIRWLFGFTEKEGEIEVTLIHSVTSGKKTIFEDGKEIVSSTNRLATDFGHTWRSETCQGRLFRVEFVTSFTTDPTVYTFTTDGIKFVDMPKKGGIGGGGGSSYGGAAKNRSINGFGTSSAVAETGGYSGSSQSSNSNSRPVSGFGAPRAEAAAPTTVTNSRRFIYDDDGEDDAGANSAPAPAARVQSTPAGAPRANFQSPFAPAPAANNVFGFDPFDESPAPAPAHKPSPAASLFNAFDESPPAAKVGQKKPSGVFDAFGDSDPFGASSDPFGSSAPAPAPAPIAAPQRRASVGPAAAAPKAPVAAAASAPVNFMDDDFAMPAAPPAPAANNDFGNFGATNATPQRRSSAIEISNDFAGLTFSAPAPVQKVAPVAAPAPVVLAPAPEVAPASKDPWSQSNLVNLDLSSGASNSAQKRPSGTTSAGPSLASMMHVPTNSRASFTAGSPSATAAPMNTMNTMNAAPMNNMNQNTRASFIAPNQGMQQGGFGTAQQQQPFGGVPQQQSLLGAQQPMSMGAQQPMSMGAQQPMGMGGVNNVNNLNSRASFNAGPGAPMMGGGAPVGGMGGGMGAMGAGANPRGSFISANPTPAMGGYGAPQQSLGQPAQPAKSSLDTLDWNF